jgi:hypothetical protein
MTKITYGLEAISLKQVSVGRSYQHLSSHDQPRIAAFFLSFDFDQRRAYFGGGVSDHSIMEHCRSIDWTATDMIGAGRYCLEAVAVIVALPPDYAGAELAVACPLFCDQRRITAELLANVTEFAVTKYRKLVARREFAHPDLIAELRQGAPSTYCEEEIEFDLCAAGKDRAIDRCHQPCA